MRQLFLVDDHGRQILALLAGLLILKFSPIQDEPGFPLSTGYYNRPSEGTAPPLSVPYAILPNGLPSDNDVSTPDWLLEQLVNNLPKSNITAKPIPNLEGQAFPTVPSDYNASKLDSQCNYPMFGWSPVPLQAPPIDVAPALGQPLAWYHNVSKYLLSVKNSAELSSYGKYRVESSCYESFSPLCSSGAYMLHNPLDTGNPSDGSSASVRISVFANTTGSHTAGELWPLQFLRIPLS